MLLSKVSKCPSMREIVSASNNALLYSKAPLIPSGPSTIRKLRSSFALPPSRAIVLNFSSDSWSVSEGMFCSTNFTWNNGERVK